MGRSEQGVTFWDVAVAARAIGKAHAVHVRFTLDLPMRETTGKALTVRCAAWASDGKGNWFDRRGVSEAWPNADSRTFSGLLLRLAYMLDEDLTSEEASAARRVQLRFDG